MKFAADCMLGSLARWLIILGHDVAYFRKIDDADLVALARRERRVILTSDRRLVLRRDARDHVLVRGHDLRDQIRQVFAERGLRLRRAALFRRCVGCNRPTRPLARLAARMRVPPYVFATQKRFLECPGCGRVFWRATHVEGMMRRLADHLGGGSARGRRPRQAARRRSVDS